MHVEVPSEAVLYLNHDLELLVCLLELSLQLVSQLYAGDRLHASQVGALAQLGHLVGLAVADEVPADLRALVQHHLVCALLLQLLYVVFSKVPVPCGVCANNQLFRLGL